MARRSRSVTLDAALTARDLEAAAELVGLTGRCERAHHGAIINPFGAKIGALNDRGPAAELPGELRLQRTEGRLRVGFAPPRRNLHHVAVDHSLRRGSRQGARHGRRRCRALRGRRPGMVSPIGIGARSSDRGATAQSERGDKDVAPAFAWRVVVHLLIVQIVRRIRMTRSVPGQGRATRSEMLMIGCTEPSGYLPCCGRFPVRAPLDLGGDCVPMAPQRTARSARADAGEPICILAELVQQLGRLPHRQFLPRATPPPPTPPGRSTRPTEYRGNIVLDVVNVH